MQSFLAKFSVAFGKPYVKIATIPITSHPASLKASTHSKEEPPVEIKSSTTTTFIPGFTNPSIRLLRP